MTFIFIIILIEMNITAKDYLTIIYVDIHISIVQK